MKRRIDLEIIRIIAILCVLINHTATNSYVSKDMYNSGTWYIIYLLLAATSRIAVPLFFMVSGALLLHRKESIREIIKHRVAKYLLIIMGFSIIQFLFQAMLGYVSVNSADIHKWLVAMYTNSVIVPYWFLYAYLGVMLMLPFLRRMVINMQAEEFEYLIILHLIFFGLLPLIESYLQIDHINISIPLACELPLFYFIIGYYVDKKLQVSSHSMVLLGIAAVTSVCVLTLNVYMSIQRLGVFENGTQYPFSSTLISIPTITVFLAAKKLGRHINSTQRISKIVFALGSASFGVYLWESIFDTISFDFYFWAKKVTIPFFAWLMWIGIDYLSSSALVIIAKKAVYKLLCVRKGKSL